MTYERLSGAELDYAPCRYGTSKLLFRGPRAALRDDYVAFLGSTETYGKFIDTPYPALTGRALGVASLNLGCVNAGIDTFHDDPTVQELCRGARACVVQVMGAHKLSNRLYTVHPRRNDRFLAASTLLRRLYPEADFADIHFTRHLLAMLRDTDEDRFEPIVEELQAAWISRMASLVERLRVPIVLLWVSAHAPEAPSLAPEDPDPLFVTRRMLDEVAARAAGIVEVQAAASEGGEPAEGMVWSELERPAALELPGPRVHARIAAALAPTLEARL